MNNEYSVRRMEEKDVEQIVAIEKDTFSQPWRKEEKSLDIVDCGL